MIQMHNCAQRLYFHTIFPLESAGSKGIKGHMLLFLGCLSITALLPYHLFLLRPDCTVKLRGSRCSDSKIKPSLPLHFYFSPEKENVSTVLPPFHHIVLNFDEIFLIFPLRFLNPLQVLVRHLQVQMSH